ncbi:MAG: hypothetical protein ACK5PF_11810 [bacterium]
MTQPMVMANYYTDSGKNIRNGPGYLSGNNGNATWRFVKTSGAATGANGAMVWDIGNQNVLVVLF